MAVALKNHSSYLSDMSSNFQGSWRASARVLQAAEYLKEHIDYKRRRRLGGRNLPDAFSGSEIIDVVIEYFQNESENGTKKQTLSRKKAAKFCNCFLILQILTPVTTPKGLAESADMMDAIFEDSNSQLFRFVADLATKNPVPQDVDEARLQEELDRFKDRPVDETDQSVEVSNYNLRSRATAQVFKNPNFESPVKSICSEHSGRASHSKKSSLSSVKNALSASGMSRRSNSIKNVAVKFKRGLKYHFSSRSIQTDVRGEILREESLARLLPLVDLPVLDSILSYENRETDKYAAPTQPEVPLTFYNPNIEIPESFPTTMNEEVEWADKWFQSARNLVKFIPAENRNKIADILSFSSRTERLAWGMRLRLFTYITHPYEVRGEALWPSQFLDLHLALYKLVPRRVRGQTEREAAQIQENALKAFQLSLQLLPAVMMEEIIHVVQFMKQTVDDEETEFSYRETNQDLVERIFTGAFFRTKAIPQGQQRQIVQFMMTHADDLGKIPLEVEEAVTDRLKEEEVEEVPELPSGTTFCARISPDSYNKQTKDATDKALRALVNTIIDDPTLTDKEKYKNLIVFSKQHPLTFERHFSDLL